LSWPNLLGWWRAARPVGLSGRREREESESEMEFLRERSTREKIVSGRRERERREWK
jgi:hypothetical protein